MNPSIQREYLTLAPLFSSPDASAAFAAALATRAIGKRLDFSPSVSSTNDLALEAAREGAPHGSLFVADAQHAGRGRRGRSWDCPPGLGLLFSVLIRPTSIPPEQSGWIPLAAGMACARAIAELPGLQNVSVKWPNDIVLPTQAAPGWRKLGGVLCESSLGRPAQTLAGAESPSSSDLVCEYVVIGVGLNLNQSAAILPHASKAPATSILLESGTVVDRRAILQSILEHLEPALDKLGDSAKRPLFQSEIEKKMSEWITPLKTLRFHAPTGDARERTGAFAGLDEFGRLRIRESSADLALADAEIVAVE